jgi:hypothetical protein
MAKSLVKAALPALRVPPFPIISEAWHKDVTLAVQVLHWDSFEAEAFLA